MKRVLCLVSLAICLLSTQAFAKSDKPIRPAHDTSSNTDLYKYVWHCTFTVTPDRKTIASCAPGKFNNARKFIPVPVQKDHHTISNRVVKFLTGFYGNETYPYEDAKSKKPVARPERCEFELTHGETANPNDTAVVHVRSGTCPLTSPSEQFLFQDRLLNALNDIVYERGDVPGGLAENNDD
ncbi:MAG: hypothetical protein NTX72_00240 [Candidatus Uhrbacteria bacterium]|nr:hypothetical protein [Candidatus Uhrbacteria bacterium]